MVDGENVPTEAQMADYERVASQWNHNEYNCRNYILNALDDSQYDIYSTISSAREIWESLKKKYRTQCSKKFVVGKFLNFKMNDANPVVKQVEELQIIVHEMEVEGMDNRMIEKADANSIELNANLVRESSSKSKSNHKTKAKMVVALDRNILRMERKITPNKRTTTSRKFIIVGSIGNLGIKLKIVATRKSMEAEILEETPTKQTMCSLQKNLLE
ncbi:hypothetical protein Tco_0953751 [Tanacetum coccineum]|uniref:Uncharacterized protein n=1 Tax=Tanacetum coccineum TaxID=301880 RepID=A0ABQ5E0S6_9ASTR